MPVDSAAGVAADFMVVGVASAEGPVDLAAARVVSAAPEVFMEEAPADSVEARVALVVVDMEVAVSEDTAAAIAELADTVVESSVEAVQAAMVLVLAD
jgi:hypothetical protein